MNYELDKSGIDKGIIQYTTENGCRYLANIYEIESGLIKTASFSFGQPKISGSSNAWHMAKFGSGDKKRGRHGTADAALRQPIHQALGAAMPHSLMSIVLFEWSQVRPFCGQSQSLQAA